MTLSQHDKQVNIGCIAKKFSLSTYFHLKCEFHVSFG